jgi:ABC-type branched-subunit amino acid transport system ATPase component
LSYGQQKLVAIARLLANEADLLLLDEPAAGVHPKMIDTITQKIKEIVDKLGKTVLIIEHNIGFVTKISDFVYLLDDGKVAVFGAPQDVIEDKAMKEAYLGL